MIVSVGTLRETIGAFVLAAMFAGLLGAEFDRRRLREQARWAVGLSMLCFALALLVAIVLMAALDPRVVK